MGPMKLTFVRLDTEFAQNEEWGHTLSIAPTKYYSLLVPFSFTYHKNKQSSVKLRPGQQKEHETATSII